MGVQPGDAPDGGWGWVIVGCSFIIHMVSVGNLFALSVLYVAWLEEFESSKGVTSWIIGVGAAVIFGIGPVVASLASRFGYRTVVICGGLLACAGFGLSFFATNVIMLVFFIGIIAGTGCGFCYLPAIAVVAIYFNKRRSVAMGIGTAGVGIGSFALAPLFHWLNEEYGWRGTLLITAGLSLNLCVCGLLMRPLQASMAGNDGGETEEKLYEDTRPMLSDVLEFEIKAEDTENAEVVLICGDNQNHEITFCNADTEIDHDNHGQVSTLDKDTISKVSLSSSGHPQQQKIRHNGPNVDSGIGRSLQVLHVSAGSRSNLFSRQCSSARDLRSSRLSCASRGKNLWPPTLHANGRLLTPDILMSGSFHSLPMINGKMNSLDHVTFVNSLEEVTDEGAGGRREQDQSCKPEVSICKVCGSLMSSFALLKDRIFLTYTISNTLTNLSYLMPVLYMVDRAVASDIDKASAAILVSINGAGNVFGRIFFGFLADRAFVDRLVCYIVCLSVCGAATCLSPLCGSSVALHGVYALTFGCFMGAYVTLAPVVTVDLVGVSMVGEAYGLLLLFMGLAGLAGPPLAGWVVDWTGSYTTSFILHGMFVLLSALMLIPVAVVKKCLRHNN